MITKIISGEQTGADQGALDAATKMGILNGDCIPADPITEDGTLPNKHTLQEMSTDSYSKRTEQNVIDSDGTVILSHGDLTGNSKLTFNLAEKHRKPCLHIDLNKTSVFIASSQINSWAVAHGIEVLNVTGATASEDPEIYKDAFYIIEGAILLGLVDAKDGETVNDFSNEEYLEKLPVPLKTVEEAVDRLISELSLKDRVTIANQNIDELLKLHNNLSIYVKNAFRLDYENKELLESCTAMSEYPIYSTDDVATVIIGVLYKKLIETHKMRLV